MNKNFKKVLTASSVLLMFAGVGAAATNSSNVHADSNVPYFEYYCGKTKRGSWGYKNWNEKAPHHGGRLYNRVYVHAGTRIYGEHDASRIGFNNYVSAYRTKHATKDTYIPKSAFKAAHHHKRYHAKKHLRRRGHKMSRRHHSRR